MQVKDIMTSPVVSIEPDTSVTQAIWIMLQRHISGLPVVDKDASPRRRGDRGRPVAARRDRHGTQAPPLA